MRCAACGFDNPPIMKFCGQCGAPLPDAIVVTQEAPPRETAERRQLTVMFCDLADAEALSARLDPEDLREIVREYQTVSNAVVESLEGHVAQYLGDGILVYFGYPQARGDDARRAVQAGLRIVAEVTELSARLEEERGLTLQVRVGIHTGPVVTGEVGGTGRREQLALGQTPNIAARLQDLAAPNDVVVGPPTLELTQGFFTVEGLGATELKGLPEPLQIYRVVAESGIRSRFELAIHRGLTPLAGRRDELARLRQAFAEAAAGRGRVAVISGEAGIGKSRLVHALGEELAAEPHAWWLCGFSRDHAALAPIAALTGRLLGLEAEASAGDKLNRLAIALSSLGFVPAETVPILADFLALELDDRYTASGLHPARLKERTLDLVIDILERSGEERPSVLVCEDVHWGDTSATAFLEGLARRAAGMHLLVVLTCLPSYSPPWLPPLHQERLELERLADREVEAMIASLAGKPMPPLIVHQLRDRVGGIPLFVEELTRMVLESGQLREGRHGWKVPDERLELDIPATLQDLLMARLDGQDEAKEIAQLAAVLGLKFDVELLTRLAGMEASTLGEQLDRLVEAGLLLAPEENSGTFAFKSALIHETAYGSLLKSTRQHYHRKVSQLLDERPELGAEPPEVVARHFTEGGLYRHAVEHWLRAGRHGLERGANQEAISHLETGLDLLAGLTVSRESARLEMSFQDALGVAWATAHGFAAKGAEAALERARELSLELGDEPAHGRALAGLWMVRFTQGKLGRALELGERILAVAQPELLLAAHTALGTTLFYQGRFEPAHEHLGSALAQEPNSAGLTLNSIADTRVSALCVGALTAWVRGRSSTGRERAHEAIDRARELEHPYSLCYALAYSAWLDIYLRDEAAADVHLDELRGIVHDQGFLSTGWDDFFLGPLLGENDTTHIGIGHTVSLTTHSGFGLNLGLTSTCSILAERYLRQGEIEKAEGALRWGFDAQGGSQERHWEGELYRLSGEIALAQGRKETAETRFRQALEITHVQGAYALELRAATSFARLLRDQDRIDEAGVPLRQAYDHLKEGFDTADVEEARALLEALP